MYDCDIFYWDREIQLKRVIERFSWSILNKNIINGEVKKRLTVYTYSIKESGCISYQPLSYLISNQTNTLTSVQGKPSQKKQVCLLHILHSL